MRIRIQLLLFMAGTLVVATAAGGIFVSSIHSRVSLIGIDRELQTAAIMARDLLPPGHHDRILDAGSVTDDEYRGIAEKLNKVCVSADLECLWSLMVLDGKIVFTSAASPGKIAARRDHARFLAVHSNPELYREAFRTMRPQFQITADRWGRIRVALIPFMDSHGRPYLMGASRSMAAVDADLHTTNLFFLMVALGILALGVLAGLPLSASLSRPVQRVTRAAAALAAGDLTAEVPVQGPREMEQLAESIREMAGSIRQRMAELTESRERLSRVLEGSSDGFWDWNVQTGDVRFSERWASMLGYTLEEIRPDLNTWERLLHPEDKPWVMRVLQEHLDGKTPAYSTEHRLRAKDGEWRWILDRGKVIVRDAEGRPLIASGTHTDISARKEAEAALQASEARFRSIFGSMTEGVALHEVVRDDSGTAVDYLILDVNPAYERLIGVSRAAAVGARASALYGAEPAPYLDVYSGVAATGEPIDFEAFFAPLAKHFRISVASTGRDRFVTIFEDTTARIRAEEERKSLEAKVQQAQKLESLGVLAGGIAHDFNNLLVSILGNADLALAGLSPASPARDSLHEIEVASRRAGELCRQMLAYSGRGRYVVERLNLNEVVEEMSHMLEVSISKKAILKRALFPGLPAVSADATQMRQIIMNLIINASEAIGDRSGIISVATGVMECDRQYLSELYLDEGLPEGLYATLEVSDTGCGMDETTRGKIFDPFFTTKFTGRGLGLAAVLGIVRGHRGAIKVYSEPGKGSTFKILFPAVEGGARRAPDEVPELPAWKGSGTVLLVDDEESVRVLGKRMLERLGFTVVCAIDGRDALLVFGEHPGDFACVVLDLTMPHMSGEDAFREMRRVRPDICVVLSSGYNEQEVTQSFSGKGLSGFVQKPYTLASLSASLRAAMER